MALDEHRKTEPDETGRFYAVAALVRGTTVHDANDPTKVGTLVRPASRLWVDRDTHPPLVRWHGKVDAEAVEWSSIRPDDGGDMSTASKAPFTWEGRDASTIGTLLKEAMRAQTESKAAEFLQAYREHNPEHADANLGYIIGYVEPAERRRELYDAFALSHPVFGGRP